MKTYRSPKIEVRYGTLAGRGVVAVEDIARDEIVAIKMGHIVHRDEIDADFFRTRGLARAVIGAIAEAIDIGM